MGAGVSKSGSPMENIATSCPCKAMAFARSVMVRMADMVTPSSFFAAKRSVFMGGLPPFAARLRSCPR